MGATRHAWRCEQSPVGVNLLRGLKGLATGKVTQRLRVKFPGADSAIPDLCGCSIVDCVYSIIS